MNIPYGKKAPISTFRKIAIGSWQHPKDPSIHGHIDFDVSETIPFIKQYNQDNNSQVHIVHFFAYCLSLCLDRYPDLNTVLIRNTLYQRKSTQIFMQVAFKPQNAYDLSGFCVKNAQNHSLKEVATLCLEKSQAIRLGKDKEINWVHKLFKRIPSAVTQWAIACFDTILYTLNINPKAFSPLPQDRFGSMMLSYIGAFGLENGYAPLFPFTRCGYSLTLGKTHLKVIQKNNRIQSIPHNRLSFTIDHRYIDGAHAGKAIRFLKKCIQTPSQYKDLF